MLLKLTMTDVKDSITSPEDAQVQPDGPLKLPAQQWQGLRRVPDKLPAVALLILVVEVRI